jgi:hypothetical protein
MRGLTRAVAAVGLAVGLLVGAAACATRAGYDEIILYYKAGVGDNRTFSECIPPGQSGDYPVDDETYSLPTTIRSWAIQHTGGDTQQAIDSGTAYGPDGQPGPHVLVYATASFYLNTNCGTGQRADKDPNSPVVQFWQKIGARGWGPKDQKIVDDNGEFSVAGWDMMLQETLVAAETKALANGTRYYTADALDSNAHGERTQVEQRIAPIFQDELRQRLGGDFFCGAAYVRNSAATWTDDVQKGTNPDGSPIFGQQKTTGLCPPIRISITDVDYADPKIAAARAAVYAAEQDAKAQVIAAQAQADKARILGQSAQNPAYLAYLGAQAQLEAAQACRANPNCTVIIGAGGGVNVNTK